MGVVGLVAVLGIAFGTLMLVGGGSSSESSTDDQTEVAESHEETSRASDNSDDEQAEALSFEDSIAEALANDESVLEAIIANLEVLDYVPTDGDLAEEQIGMSVEDSIEAVNWLVAEKSKLADREKELTAREKKLKLLDNSVSKKITRIEQAEATRVSKLAKLYDGMESRSVARLIANLDDNTVVALLPRMKLKNASQVLALMPPIRAARLSKQMITIAEN